MLDNEINNFIQMSWERTRILDEQGHMLRGDERLKEKNRFWKEIEKYDSVQERGK